MTDYILLATLVASLFGNVWQLVGEQRLKRVLRQGLLKAEKDRCEMVRIPYNQLAGLLGWKPEYRRYTYRNRQTGGETRVGWYQSSVYPIKETK